MVLSVGINSCSISESVFIFLAEFLITLLLASKTNIFLFLLFDEPFIPSLLPLLVSSFFFPNPISVSIEKLLLSKSLVNVKSSSNTFPSSSSLD